MYQSSLRLIRTKEERLQKSKQSVIFRQPERLYDGFLQKLDNLNQQLTYSMRDKLQTVRQKQGLLHQKLQGIDLKQRIHIYQERVVQSRRLLSSTMTSQYDSKLARFEKAQDALISLDSSRIVARGYAIIEKPYFSIYY